MAIQVSVIGSGTAHEARAEEVGRLLAERGCTVVCGGRGEVMAAAARGAKAAGGTTIGIRPGTSLAEEVGRLLAERGCTVVCGGRGEVMAAAARGAKAAGGTTIGILPGTSRAD